MLRSERMMGRTTSAGVGAYNFRCLLVSSSFAHSLPSWPQQKQTPRRYLCYIWYVNRAVNWLFPNWGQSSMHSCPVFATYNNNESWCEDNIVANVPQVWIFNNNYEKLGTVYKAHSQICFAQIYRWIYIERERFCKYTNVLTFFQSVYKFRIKGFNSK